MSEQPPGMTWSSDALAGELAEDFASLCQELYAFQLGTLTEPRFLDIEAAERAGYVRGSLAKVTLPPEVVPAPPLAHEPTERRTRRTRRAITVNSDGTVMRGGE